VIGWIQDIVRQWRCDHEWSDKPAFRHEPDYMGGGYRVQGKRCLKCFKFKGELIVDIYPRKCPECGK
jgi:hypothetical protein